MFIPFTKEENLLNEKPFLDHEVQYNLFHRILDSHEVLALKTKDNNAIALQNPGHSLWFWINEELGATEVVNLVEELCQHLLPNKLPSVAARPDIAKLFGERYSQLLGISHKTLMGMESYHCPKVIKPKHSTGHMITAQQEHMDIVAEYLVGFIKWSFDKRVTKDSQMASAERLTNSGNLFLWVVDGQIVTMTNISHRSERHARINSVYTPLEHRKKGYASALVAAVSEKVLQEGLVPILYADLVNPDSNKVYRNIGYKEGGKIEEIVFEY